MLPRNNTPRRKYYFAYREDVLVLHAVATYFAFAYDFIAWLEFGYFSNCPESNYICGRVVWSLKRPNSCTSVVRVHF